MLNNPSGYIMHDMSTLRHDSSGPPSIPSGALRRRSVTLQQPTFCFCCSASRRHQSRSRAGQPMTRQWSASSTWFTTAASTCWPPARTRRQNCLPSEDSASEPSARFVRQTRLLCDQWPFVWLNIVWLPLYVGHFVDEQTSLRSSFQTVEFPLWEKSTTFFTSYLCFYITGQYGSFVRVLTTIEQSASIVFC